MQLTVIILDNNRSQLSIPCKACNLDSLWLIRQQLNLHHLCFFDHWVIVHSNNEATAIGLSCASIEIN